MRVEIITAEQQWKEVFENFLKTGNRVENMECDSYSPEVFVATANRYIRKFGYPVRVSKKNGEISFSRTDI